VRHRLPSRAVTLVAALSIFAWAVTAGAVTPTGRLQVIHLDVGQGDAALLISPLGEVALIDDGPGGTGAMGVTVVGQLQALGVTHIAHHFASHYHADHIGAIDDIVNAGITIHRGWDRGGSYTTAAYTTYVNKLGSARRTIVKNQVVTLDSLSLHPVTIKCVNLAGAGLYTGTEENNLSLVLKVSYGEFDAVFGGDLPGATTGSYKDIETTVGPQVGPVELYKVHHHGSASSSNAAWLAAIQPKIGVISLGNGNSYNHPTAAALSRLHAANVRTYWTETGSGVAPDPAWDKVASGQVIISATWEPAGVDTVRGGAFVDTFTNSGTALDLTAPVVALASPNGGESWETGTIQDIAWTATDNFGVTAIDLAYSTDGGATWPETIATGLANAGTYPWTVPDLDNRTVRIRVTAHDAAGFVAVAESAADFGIVGSTSGVIDVAFGAGEVLGVFPNPSGGRVSVQYRLGAGGDVRVSVHDVRGYLIAETGEGRQDPGDRQATWDGRTQRGGRPVAPGVYFLHVTVDGRDIGTRRVMVLR